MKKSFLIIVLKSQELLRSTCSEHGWWIQEESNPQCLPVAESMAEDENRHVEDSFQQIMPPYYFLLLTSHYKGLDPLN